jgi:hypothetical protein
MTVHSPIDPLESALADLVARVDITDVDAFTAATMVKVRRGRDDARRRRSFSVVRGSNARQVLAVAAAILLVVTAVLAVPRSRDAIADLLGIDGLRIRSGEGPIPTSTSVPAMSSTASSTSTSAPTGSSSTVGIGGGFDAVAVGRDLKLGSQVSMSDARNALPALRELNSAYGPPDAIYRGERPAGLVSFVWRARPDLPGSTFAPSVGLVVQQYRSSTGDIFPGKTVTPGSTVREIVVEGKKGYWIDGAPHSIAYFDAQGSYIEDTVRWASNALVWAANGVTHRIESSLTQEEAVALVALLE